MWCMISRARLDIMLSCRHHVAKLIRLGGGGSEGAGTSLSFQAMEPRNAAISWRASHAVRCGVWAPGVGCSDDLRGGSVRGPGTWVGQAQVISPGGSWCVRAQRAKRRQPGTRKSRGSGIGS